uniref:Uncharacterized protein n=1 Tax=Zea mays TaxID=4577 RepID=C0HIW4_MAIZE|nr:unknown [Zea mays]
MHDRSSGLCCRQTSVFTGTNQVGLKLMIECLFLLWPCYKDIGHGCAV